MRLPNGTITASPPADWLIRAFAGCGFSVTDCGVNSSSFMPYMSASDALRSKSMRRCSATGVSASGSAGTCTSPVSVLNVCVPDVFASSVYAAPLLFRYITLSMPRYMATSSAGVAVASLSSSFSDTVTCLRKLP